MSELSIQEVETEKGATAELIDQDAEIFINVIENHRNLCKFQFSSRSMMYLLCMLAMTDLFGIYKEWIKATNVVIMLGFVLPLAANIAKLAWIAIHVIAFLSVMVGVLSLLRKQHTLFRIFFAVHYITTFVSFLDLGIAEFWNLSWIIRSLCIIGWMYQLIIMTEMFRINLEITRRLKDSKSEQSKNKPQHDHDACDNV